MDVFVSLEHRFNRTPDGSIWTPTVCAYSFWTRYLEVFDQVRVVARIQDVAAPQPDWKLATGQGVSFVTVPYYIGPWQYLQQVRHVERVARNVARSVISQGDAVIMRVSSTIAGKIESKLRQVEYPYGLEIVADPYDVFAPGSIRHPLRPFFRWWFTSRLQQQCANASATAYVTQHALQHRYPPSSGTFSTHYSSVELPSAAFVTAPDRPMEGQSAFTLITVGTLAQLYKAPDVLIDAVALVVQEGLDLSLVLAGDGQYRSDLEVQAASRGIGPKVHFLGQLPGAEAVRARLDEADLFVLPSHQEGLPRAMIEAMARALPCIGSTVGGIPELLPAEDLVPPGNAGALAQKIREVVVDPERMARMSARNLQKAKEYREEILQRRRTDFYRYVQERTEVWLENSGR